MPEIKRPTRPPIIERLKEDVTALFKWGRSRGSGPADPHLRVLTVDKDGKPLTYGTSCRLYGSDDLDD